MSITSVSFLGFLLAGILLYYLLPFSCWKKAVLLTASFVFYCSFQLLDFSYLVVVILYCYLLGFFIAEYKKPAVLVLGIVPIVFGLCYYKYSYVFFREFAVESIVAPLGISFFTFKSIGYLVDVYRDKDSLEKSLLNYAVYISFFPQISSGPIQGANSFLEKIDRVKKIDDSLTRHGFILCAFGYFEKLVIAERLYIIVSKCFSNLTVLTPSLALMGILAYSFQIYADFDAYSNIAIGIGELFGIECEKNFNAPYLSRNIKEFWERWHISLSSWLKEYVYIPLGGSRKGTLRKYFNLTVVFLVSGIWHGSTLNFLLWGLMNAFFRIVYDILEQCIFSKIHISFLPVKWILTPVQVILNFSLVSFLWIVFKSSSIEEFKIICYSLIQFDWHAFSFDVPDLATAELIVTFLLTLLLIFCDILRNLGFTLYHFGKLCFPLRWCAYLVMIVLGIIFAVYGPGYDPSKFIYIEF